MSASRAEVKHVISTRHKYSRHFYFSECLFSEAVTDNKFYHPDYTCQILLPREIKDSLLQILFILSFLSVNKGLSLYYIIIVKYGKVHLLPIRQKVGLSKFHAMAIFRVLALK